jgi:hypothetical protein
MDSFSKWVFLLLSISCIPRYAHSAEYYVGINGGLSLSTVLNTSPDNLWRSAFTGYGSISIKPNSFLILQLQVGYAMKGYRWEDEWNELDSLLNPTSTIHKDKYIDNYDYIEVPILAKFLFFTKRPIHLSICIGPVLSYLSSAKSDIIEDGRTISRNYDEKYRTNLIDAGFTFGIGLERPLGPGKITFDIRNSSGLLNILKKDLGVDIEKTTNQSFYFLLGYEYKLK